MFERTVGVLSEFSSQAAATLAALFMNPSEKSTVRNNAANNMLTHQFRAKELIEVEERIAALEAAERRRSRK